ncbi:MAG: GNAT family N-acetyltransferase, partial [Planctomycetia bacterium]
PIAADYQLLGNGIVYSYQSGLDPDYLHVGPGDIVHGELVHRYIQQGILSLDFLRGDEEYKRYWQAEPRSTSIWYVAAPHWSSRCRDFVRRVGEEAKAVAKRGLSPILSK